MYHMPKTGYHAMAKEYVQDSITNQAIHPSTDTDEWLGHGVYFFQYISDARWWTTLNRFKGRETAILQAALTYTSDQLLDLDNPDERIKLERFYKTFTSKNAKSNNPVSFLGKKKLSREERWCLACNLFRSVNPNIGIIIYTFPRCKQEQKNQLSPFLLFPHTQRQICVSDDSIISDIQEVPT